MPAGEVRELGQRGQHAGAADQPPVHRRGSGGGRARGAFGQRFRHHVQGLDGGHDAVQRAFGVHHGQHALHQVEVQRMHAVQAVQLFTDQRFFGRAVHLPDTQPRQQLAGAGAKRGCIGGGRIGGRAVVVPAAGGCRVIVAVIVFVAVAVIVSVVVIMIVAVPLRVMRMAMATAAGVGMLGRGTIVGFDRRERHGSEPC
ncbi:hypothetical protein D3C87_1205350 [compost metagenome]